MRNYVYTGDAIEVTAPATVSAGQLVKLGTALMGVACADAASAAAVVIARRGVFDLSKANGSSTSLAVGDLVYVSATAANVTTSASSNTLVGTVIAAASNTDTTVRVALAE
jgi:predicted RecA/RadA family phage recombinase